MKKVALVKFLFILCLLVAASMITWGQFFRKYHQQDVINIHHFPRVIGAWEAEDLPMSAMDYAGLETRNAFVRRYRSAQGLEVYLFVVYSENNRKVSHPPEICYAGSDVQILARTTDVLGDRSAPEAVPVNTLLLEKAGVQQVALYWFKAGPVLTRSYWHQQILLAWNIFQGRSAGGALMRVAVTVQGGQILKAEAQAKAFARQIMPSIQEYLP